MTPERLADIQTLTGTADAGWGTPSERILSAMCRDLLTERAKLFAALAKVGFSVMQTSGEWSIHCTTEAAKRAEEVETRVLSENMDLLVENKALRELADSLVAAIGVAHNSLFEQCYSNPIQNAWGEDVNMTTLNDANEKANAAAVTLAKLDDRGDSCERTVKWDKEQTAYLRQKLAKAAVDRGDMTEATVSMTLEQLRESRDNLLRQMSVLQVQANERDVLWQIVRDLAAVPANPSTSFPLMTPVPDELVRRAAALVAKYHTAGEGK
jgi:hypothetical protein